MGRPKSALISRDAVLEAALKIIDDDGLDRLSIRTIAKEIGVHGASLYHHFENKDEIINGAMELALSRTPLRRQDGAWQSWQRLLLAGTYQLLEFLLHHPHLVPVFSQRRATGLGNHFLEGNLRQLIAAGMPISIALPLFETLEALTVGWAIRHISKERAQSAECHPDSHPLLHRAEQATELTHDEVYARSMQSIIEGFGGPFDPQPSP